jgi:superfamily I DNA and/or RNA helicase
MSSSRPLPPLSDNNVGILTHLRTRTIIRNLPWLEIMQHINHISRTLSQIALHTRQLHTENLIISIEQELPLLLLEPVNLLLQEISDNDVFQRTFASLWDDA